MVKKVKATAVYLWLLISKHKITVLVSAVMLLAVGIGAVVFYKLMRGPHPERAEQMGSFLGGYLGSLFALLGVLLLYATLKSQRISSAQQNFETKYFELLKMHRDNVAEIDLQEASGRRVFVLLLVELRSALAIIRRVARECEQPLSDTRLMHVAYYCTFFGVGPNSSRMLKCSLSEFDRNFIDRVEHELSRDSTKRQVVREQRLGYVPFEGHQSRLGHYYRHLFQMVRYVDEQSPALNIPKYEFVKTIRAQLSTHEQALLLINSLTPIGRIWWEMQFIENYRLVQNLPQNFFDRATELDLKEIFPAQYFEWEEVLASANIQA
jgi:hypothetical protein